MQKGSAGNTERRGDARVIVIGLLLAVSASAFAASTLYSGPMPQISDFRLADLAANRKNDGTPFGPTEIDIDSITTGSLNDEPVLDSPAQLPGWFREPGRPISYRLRSAVAKRALVDVSSGASSFIYKVETGGLLPGLGRVQSIGMQNGRWQIVTGRTRISSAGAELVGEQNAGQGAQSR